MRPRVPDWLVVVCAAWLAATSAVVCATDVVPWRAASAYVGDVVTVEGDVVQAHLEAATCVLDFAPDDPSAFRVVLLIPLLTDLPHQPQRLYEGKRVRATGTVRRFAGRAEMIVRSPDAIEVVGVASAPAVAAAPPPTTLPPPTTPPPTTPPTTLPPPPAPPPAPAAAPPTPAPSVAPPAPEASPPPPLLRLPPRSRRRLAPRPHRRRPPPPSYRPRLRQPPRRPRAAPRERRRKSPLASSSASIRASGLANAGARQPRSPTPVPRTSRAACRETATGAAR